MRGRLTYIARTEESFYKKGVPVMLQSHARFIPLALIAAALIAALVVVAASLAQGAEANNRNFVAHLSGHEEVPPVPTLARGQTVLQLNKAGTELKFKLIVANIEDVTQAHIHCGARGVNGPVVAFLYGFGPVVSPNGILSQGTITDADIIAVPDSEACPGGVADFDEMMAKIRSGDAYVNVHTEANPGGEIRGQIR